MARFVETRDGWVNLDYVISIENRAGGLYLLYTSNGGTHVIDSIDRLDLALGEVILARDRRVKVHRLKYWPPKDGEPDSVDVTTLSVIGWLVRGCSSTRLKEVVPITRDGVEICNSGEQQVIEDHGTFHDSIDCFYESLEQARQIHLEECRDDAATVEAWEGAR
jgi:hypothetical protein